MAEGGLDYNISVSGNFDDKITGFLHQSGQEEDLQETEYLRPSNSIKSLTLPLPKKKR